MTLTTGATAQTDFRAAAKMAYIFGLPLLEFARVRARSLRASPPNRFTHGRALATPAARVVTTPNNDTLYSTAFLDLRDGPVILTLPPSGERYLSVALMDAYTNNFAIPGTRTTGSDGGRFTVVGPQAAAGPGIIRAPTPWVWALARTLVDGPQDLAAAYAVQDGIVASGPAAGAAPETSEPRDGAPLAILTAIWKLLRENPPRPADAAALAQAKPALINYEVARLTPEAVAALSAGVQDGRDALRGLGLAIGAPVQGWTYPRATLGDFGTDYAYRAGVAVNGLAALPPAEAMYMRPAGPGGRSVFEGGSDYALHFARGRLPPLLEPGGFWSLTMYEVDSGEQLWLTPNALDRYAIGDRTPGLRRDADGGLTLRIGPDDPGPAHRANWLPAPRGPWTVVMRAYLPAPALRDGSWRLPALAPA